jgi:hypothetical protein
MHQLKFNSGIESEVFTSFSLNISKQKPEFEVGVNKINLLFPCSSSIIAKSMQVLLLPYFAKWNPLLSLKDNYLVVSIPLLNPFLIGCLSLQVQTGMKLDQIKGNIFLEVLESLKIAFNCTNINEVLELCGFPCIRIQNITLNLSLNPEDLPKEIKKHFEDISNQYSYVLEFLLAIKPFLSHSQVLIAGSIGENYLKGIFDY